MAETLAVKYRPLKFEDVVEQNITSRILKRQLELRKFKNGYLFSGSSGCGKTTIARIFANEINDNLGYPIEYDCASHNSVEDVRSIVEQSRSREMNGAEYKIFILDECHMFTTAAWNAFLKGIEEPSEYTIYIFCTTEPSKIPETVLNRLQRYNFGKISVEGIKRRLEYICLSEGFTNYLDAIDLIAKASDGSMRDAITTLEQCSDYSTDLSIENIKEIIGDISYSKMIELTTAITQSSTSDIINIVEKMYTEGKDLKAFLSSYFSFIMDINKYLLFKTINITNIPNYLEQDVQGMVCQCGSSLEEARVYFNKFSECIMNIRNMIRFDSSYKNSIIVNFVKMSRGDLEVR